MFIQLFLTIFIMVLLAELADKTQFVTFALVAETGKPVEAYLGVLGGLFCVTALGVLAGSLIGLFIPLFLIQIIAGIIFIIIGGYALYKARSNNDEEEVKGAGSKRVWTRAFALLFFAELGDKTQILVIFLVATTGQLLLVFLAAFSALAVVNGIGVIIGDRARHYLGTSIIKYVAAIAFIIAGILMLLIFL
ncbi:MAG: TMEM165/GDT1 family protein [Promethearchaeota archaeon]